MFSVTWNVCLVELLLVNEVRSAMVAEKGFARVIFVLEITIDKWIYGIYEMVFITRSYSVCRL